MQPQDSLRHKMVYKLLTPPKFLQNNATQISYTSGNFAGIILQANLILAIFLSYSFHYNRDPSNLEERHRHRTKTISRAIVKHPIGKREQTP